MRVDVVTIFPDYLAPLELSLIGKARRDGLLDVRVHDLRDFARDRHRTVDGHQVVRAGLRLRRGDVNTPRDD